MSTFVIGVDPGDKTGIALWVRGTDAIVVKEIPGTEVGVFITSVLEAPSEKGSEFIIASERFLIAAHTHKKRGATRTAPSLIGDLRRVAEDHRAEFRLRGASDAKTFCPNARLHKLKWYTPGKGHANDAARQVVLCIGEVWPNELAQLLERT